MVAKLKYGVGVNDANYATCGRTAGVKITCPIYTRWDNLLKRCHSLNKSQASYEDCTVVSEWHSFMNFRSWVLSQGDVTGLQIDKDLKGYGSKEYGPATCIFITREVNCLIKIAVKGYRKSDNPHNKLKPYQAQIHRDGKKKAIGSYATSELARYAYLVAKSDLIKEVACTSTPKLSIYLKRYANYVLSLP